MKLYEIVCKKIFERDRKFTKLTINTWPEFVYSDTKPTPVYKYIYNNYHILLYKHVLLLLREEWNYNSYELNIDIMSYNVIKTINIHKINFLKEYNNSNLGKDCRNRIDRYLKDNFSKYYEVKTLYSKIKHISIYAYNDCIYILNGERYSERQLRAFNINNLNNIKLYDLDDIYIDHDEKMLYEIYNGLLSFYDNESYILYDINLKKIDGLMKTYVSSEQCLNKLNIEENNKVVFNDYLITKSNDKFNLYNYITDKNIQINTRLPSHSYQVLINNKFVFMLINDKNGGCEIFKLDIIYKIYN